MVAMLLCTIALTLVPVTTGYNRFWINYKTTLKEDIQSYHDCLSDCGAYWETVNTVNENKKESSMLRYLGFDPPADAAAPEHPFSKAFPPEDVGWTVPPSVMPNDLLPIPTMCRDYRFDGVWDPSPSRSQLGDAGRLHNDCEHFPARFAALSSNSVLPSLPLCWQAHIGASPLIARRNWSRKG